MMLPNFQKWIPTCNSDPHRMIFLRVNLPRTTKPFAHLTESPSVILDRFWDANLIERIPSRKIDQFSHMDNLKARCAYHSNEMVIILINAGRWSARLKISSIRAYYNRPQPRTPLFVLCHLDTSHDTSQAVTGWVALLKKFQDATILTKIFSLSRSLFFLLTCFLCFFHILVCLFLFT